jgi:hypothetical protein
VRSVTEGAPPTLYLCKVFETGWLGLDLLCGVLILLSGSLQSIDLTEEFWFGAIFYCESRGFVKEFVK